MWLQIIPALPVTIKFNGNVLQSHARFLELIFRSYLLPVQAERKKNNKKKSASYFAPKVEIFPIIQGMFMTNSWTQHCWSSATAVMPCSPSHVVEEEEGRRGKNWKTQKNAEHFPGPISLQLLKTFALKCIPQHQENKVQFWGKKTRLVFWCLFSVSHECWPFQNSQPLIQKKNIQIREWLISAWGIPQWFDLRPYIVRHIWEILGGLTVPEEAWEMSHWN